MKPQLVAGDGRDGQVQRGLISRSGDQAGLLAAGTAHSGIHGQVPAAGHARPRRVGAGEAAAGLAEPFGEHPPGQAVFTAPQPGRPRASPLAAARLQGGTAHTGGPERPACRRRITGPPPAAARASSSAAVAAPDRARLADQQVTGLAAEHLADDFQVIQADGDRLPGPQVRHLPGADHQPGLGEHPLQLRGLPDVALGSSQAQVPPHGRSPPSRPAARRPACTQASSTWLRWTCT